MANPRVDILMYHSVSTAEGPTSIPPDVFASQMEQISAARSAVVSLDTLFGRKNGASICDQNQVIITFDDAFADFVDVAWPVMKKFGFKPIVYVPTAHVGKKENWRGANSPARPLMDWPTIRALADEGVIFGSHTVTHRDLQSLSRTDLDCELCKSREELEDRLGRQVVHFAPPYGLTNTAVRGEIAKQYKTSVGTRLGQATEGSDIFDLPRLEMFYFQNPNKWRRHLEGRGSVYLKKRQALRKARALIAKPWSQF